jgi:hypothetical protein
MHHQALYTSQEALDYLEKARSGKIKEANKFGHQEIDDYLRFKQKILSLLLVMPMWERPTPFYT